MRFQHKLRSYSAALVCACLSFAFLAGCNAASNNPSNQNEVIHGGVNDITFVDETELFVGTWKADVIDSLNEDIALSAQDLTELNSMGLGVTLYISDDGTAKLDWLGEVTEGTWEDDSEIHLVTLGKVEYEAMLSGDTLQLTDGADVFHFSKSSSASGSAGELDPTTMTRIEKTLVDDEFCSITVLEAGYDSVGNPGYNLSITNKLAMESLYVNAEYGTFSLSAFKKVNPVLSATVSPGKTLEAFMYVNAEEFSGGADGLEGLNGELTVVNADTIEVIEVVPFTLE